MRKIKKIATGGIVGTLLFVNSGVVRAQNSQLPTRPSQRNEILDTETNVDEGTDIAMGISADDDIDSIWSESKDTLLEQGLSPSQIKKLSRSGYRED